jgi:hypothetical protein
MAAGEVTALQIHALVIGEANTIEHHGYWGRRSTPWSSVGAVDTVGLRRERDRRQRLGRVRRRVES